MGPCTAGRLGADVGLLLANNLMAISNDTDELTAVVLAQQDGQAPQGFVWQARQYEGLSCDFVEMLQAFGGSWICRPGEPSLDSRGASAATWMKSLINAGISPRAVTNYAESSPCRRSRPATLH